MQQKVLYIKLDKDVEVTRGDIFLKDLGSIYCENDTVVNKCNSLKIAKLKGPNSRKVISVIKIIELLSREFPFLVIHSIGETDVVVEWIKVDRQRGVRLALKVLFVSLISFFGTAFTIMAFHNDVQIQELFNKVHELVTGMPSNGYSILEFMYSVGLCLGIIIFFNHIGGKRISKDPTPIEVAMRNYEEDVNMTLINNAERLNMEIDVKKDS